MAVLSPHTTLAALAACSLFWSACRKDERPGGEEQGGSASKAAQAAISSEKKDRKILFLRFFKL